MVIFNSKLLNNQMDENHPFIQHVHPAQLAVPVLESDAVGEGQKMSATRLKPQKGCGRR